MNKPYRGIDGLSEEFPLGPSKKIVVREVSMDSAEFLDIRAWIRFTGETEYKPLRQGLFIRKDTVQSKLMPILARLTSTDGELNQNDTHTDI